MKRILVLLILAMVGCASKQDIAFRDAEILSLRAELEKAKSEIKKQSDTIRDISNADETFKKLMATEKKLADEVIKNESLSRSIKSISGMESQLEHVYGELNRLTQENNSLKNALALYDNPLSLYAAEKWQFIKRIQGSHLYAQDSSRTYLGVIDFTGSHSESIFNEVGMYGSDMGINSIWNDVGLFGSDVAINSPSNNMTVYPPLIVKDGKIIGHLTKNKYIVSPLIVNPDELKTYYEMLQKKR
ncbi:MAG: hypothetical protein R3F47_07470 [Gammaproteobacteria bacterium]